MGPYCTLLDQNQSESVKSFSCIVFHIFTALTFPLLFRETRKEEIVQSQTHTPHIVPLRVSYRSSVVSNVFQNCPEISSILCALFHSNPILYSNLQKNNVLHSLLLPLFQNYQALYTFWISHSNLTGITATKLKWHLSDMNVLQWIWMIILNSSNIPHLSDMDMIQQIRQILLKSHDLL